MKELANKQQIKVVAQGLTLSAELSVKLLRSGEWQPTNREVLSKYLEALNSSINYLTELVKEQYLMSEVEAMLKGVKGNEQ